MWRRSLLLTYLLNYCFKFIQICKFCSSSTYIIFSLTKIMILLTAAKPELVTNTVTLYTVTFY